MTLNSFYGHENMAALPVRLGLLLSAPVVDYSVTYPPGMLRRSQSFTAFKK